MRELCEFEEHFLVQLASLRDLSKAMHWVDAATICRTIHRIGMTRQKINPLHPVAAKCARKLACPLNTVAAKCARVHVNTVGKTSPRLRSDAFPQKYVIAQHAYQRFQQYVISGGVP